MTAVLRRRTVATVSSVFLGLVLAIASHAKIDSESIVGLWLLDEGRGDVAGDASGNDHDGKLLLEPKWVDGKFGKALEFDGIDDVVLFNAAERPEHAYIFHQPTDGTFMFWVMRLEMPHVAIFWTRGDGIDKGRFNAYAGAGENFGFTYKGDNGVPHGIFSRTVELFLDEWTHLAITREDNRYVVYKDGAKADANVDDEPDLPTATAWMAAGRPGFIFRGLLDEIASFNTVLSQEDIAQIVDRGLEKTALAVSPAGKLATAWAQIKSAD